MLVLRITYSTIYRSLRCRANLPAGIKLPQGQKKFDSLQPKCLAEGGKGMVKLYYKFYINLKLKPRVR